MNTLLSTKLAIVTARNDIVVTDTSTAASQPYIEAATSDNTRKAYQAQ